MKSKTLVALTAALMILVLSSHAFAQDQSEPNLSDTTEWIKEKLEANILPSLVPWMMGKTWYKSVDFSGCAFRFKFEWSFPNGGGREYEFSGTLSDLDAERIQIHQTDVNDMGAYSIWIWTKKYAPKIRSADHYWFDSGKPDKYADEEWEMFEIVVKDKELAQRLTEAIKHSIRLCSKKEPF
jgi:hypothetical protein